MPNFHATRRRSILSITRRSASTLRALAYAAFSVAFIALSLTYAPATATAAPGDNPTYPDLSLAFSPTPVATGAASVLTYTVTNTAGLPAHSGVGFVNTLPAGLTVAAGSTPTTCGPESIVNASAGATVISWTGSLAAGTESCTIKVPVTSPVEGTFVNDPTGFVTTALNTPLAATLEVGVGPDNWGECPTTAFLFQHALGSNTGPTRVYEVNLVTGSTTQVGVINAGVNAVGFNPVDNNMWGWNLGARSLTRINPDFTVTNFPGVVTHPTGRPGYFLG